MQNEPQPSQTVPQSLPPAPKKRSDLFWFLIFAVPLIVVILVVVILAANANKQSKLSALQTVIATVTFPTFPTDTPRPVSPHHKVGESVVLSHWQLVINSATIYAGDGQYDVPKSGNTYLLIEGSFMNRDAQSQTLSTLFAFELQDTQGNKYTESLLTSVSMPDGTVLGGGQAHGKWGYEVPQSVHSFLLIFTPDFQTTEVWDIGI